MEERNSRPPRKGAPSRPSSSRPSSSRSGGERSERPSRPGARADFKQSRGGRTDRAGAPRQDIRGARPAPLERDPSRVRPRIFEPDLPEEITGENLDKSLRAELLSLSAENAKHVARHLEAINVFADSDPLRAHKHGVAAAHHAGRLAVVRESAGYAAYRAGEYEIALKELRAAHRISGDVSMWPVLADCERGLGNPRKALTLAGSPEVKRLDKAQEIEMRIVAAGARRDLGEIDAAVVTLQCKELKSESEEWALRLRYAYADALAAAGRVEEAREWFQKCADVDPEEYTDALERIEEL